ncbi:ribonuclease H-like domain-containing protein [Mycena pura]|uniref:Ribonuclease H-like domain-containing protein n=1 Tax=Mycena pura TaxID=153505 RepID=A0AAD6YNM5_9AGAR|nr:ribonuclease H-like domain-containing protein [Mycena pura]
MVDELRVMKRSATLIIDGWEDELRRSLYGSAAGRVGEPTVILGLQDLTGHRGNAVKICEAAEAAMEEMLIENAACFLGLVTDNPNVMKAFRREFVVKYSWIIPLACWVHQTNTLVGEICRYADAKSALQRGNRVVTFFNGSHYWGGQLKSIALDEKVTRGLKKNCESRWYAIILLAMSVTAHHSALTRLTARPDARKKTEGLSPVNEDVLRIVKDCNDDFWPWLTRVVRVARPFVDTIAETEGRNVNLADCMLSLLGAARQLYVLEPTEDDDLDFADFKKHAHQVVDKRFRAMATPVHRLALFLHPLCRKLAVLDADGYTLRDLKLTALDIAINKWGWSADEGRMLVTDIDAYYSCAEAFAGAQRDGRGWWLKLPVAAAGHPLKQFAIALLGLVPHSAEIERLFSSCNGIQSPKRNSLSVETFSKLAKIRSTLVEEAKQRAPPKTVKPSKKSSEPSATVSEPATRVTAENSAPLGSSEALEKWERPLDDADPDAEGAAGNEDEDLPDVTIASAKSKPKKASQLSLMRGDLYSFELVKKALENVVPHAITHKVDVVKKQQPGHIDIESLL